MASPIDILTAPLKLGLGIAQNATKLGAGAVRAALGAVAGGNGAAGPLRDVESQPPRSHESPPPPTPARPPAPQRDAPPASPTKTRAPAPPEDRTPLREAPPPAPLPVDEAAPVPGPGPTEGHVDTEPVLVAAVAEEGAEDGAGAQLHVDEPWDGYGSMRAPDIRRRLEQAGREELAAVELYEGLHKARSSVLDTASRRLTQLS